MSRPEHTAPPEIFYNESEARKYTTNSRMIEIQSEMTQRALELLNLPDRPCLILDIGCGSGLSGEEVSEQGHHWVGMDISHDMLNIAKERESEGDLFLGDAGQGVVFRPGMFDGAISISCIQWLCNADKANHNPRKRLTRFFSTLYTSLTRGGRAVFQFYPENPDQVDMITTSATRSGFGGGLVIDYPNSTKKKKYFLCLFAGVAPDRPNEIPKPLDDDMEIDSVAYTDRQEHRSGSSSSSRRRPAKDRNWVLHKKETARRRGQQVAPDTKYTARKRRPKF